ncbi:alpha-xenorhabdolysin family binary toxin subunit A [Pseudomonas syringae]
MNLPKRGGYYNKDIKMMHAEEQSATDGEAHSADEVAQAGNDFMSVVSGHGEGVKRPPGLFVTNNDVKSIHAYVSKGLTLPTDLKEVEQLIGDYGTSISGLGPEAIQKLYVDIHAHAASWSPVEKDMCAVGHDLYIFSSSLIVNVDAMIALIHRLEFWEVLKPDSLTQQQIESLPPIALLDNDRKRLPGLVALFGEIERLIVRHSISTTRVKEGLSVFKQHLQDRLTPEVARKINLAKSSESNEKILRLNEDITLLNQRIEQKMTEYEEYAAYRWVGFWWGPIGGAVSLSIYGPKANDALKEKDRLIAEKQALERKLRSLNKMVADLHAFETYMQDLKIRMDGAASGANSIESLWALLTRMVKSSRQELETLDDGTILLLFSSRLETLLKNWTDIKLKSLNLLTAFNNALEDHSV